MINTPTIIPSPPLEFSPTIINNWAGYLVETNITSPTSNVVTRVSASWRVPVVPISNYATILSIWVGIDGYPSGTIQQCGIDLRTQDAIKLFAWYEMYPNPTVVINNFIVEPGDLISASVEYITSGIHTGEFLLTVNNISRNITFSIYQTAPSTPDRKSAEWIVEAQIIGAGPSTYTMPDFGIITFTECEVVISGITGPINSGSWQKRTISISSTDNVASTSQLTDSGSSFSIIKSVPIPIVPPPPPPPPPTPIPTNPLYSQTVLRNPSLISYWQCNEINPIIIYGQFALADTKSGNFGTFGTGGTHPGLALLNQPGNGVLGPSIRAEIPAFFTALQTAVLNNVIDLTLECWIKITSIDFSHLFNYLSLFQKTDFSGSGYSLLIDSHTNLLSIYTGASTYHSGINIIDSQWHHLVVTFNHLGNIILYEDSVNRYSIAGSYNFTDTRFPGLQTGFQISGAGNYNLMHCAVYNSVLSPTDITNHYNLGITP